jgi:amino acid transporter
MSAGEHVSAANGSGGAGHAGGGLRRAITGLTNGAITYACAGITAGIFSLFAFSLAASGPTFFWGWLLVGLSVGLACLVYAELASHYPFAASIYHWPLQLMGRRAGWWVGWMYLGALLSLVGAYTIVMPTVLGPLFDFTPSRNEIILIGLGLLVIALVMNLVDIHVLGRLTVIGVVAELIVLFVLSVLVYLFGPHRSPSILFDAGGTGGSAHTWLAGFLGGGIFVGLWALYTFETAGTLGEETVDAKRQAPKAVMGALLLSVFAGAVFLFLMLLSIPNVGDAMQSATPLQDIISGALADWVAKLYLVTMAWVLLLATYTIFTAACRHIFGMARARQLPFSTALSRTSRNGEPWVAAVVLAVITSLPLILVTQNLAVLVTGATGAIYFAYTLVLGIALVARLRGWPREPAPFSLGRWGIPVNVLAFIGALLTLINLLWPRDSTNPVFKLNIRVSYWLIGIPLVIGIVYYALWQHRALGAEPVDEPAEESEQARATA